MSTASLFSLPNPNMVPSYTVSPLRSCARRFPSPNPIFWRRIYRRKKVERINLHIISLNLCEWRTERTFTLLSEYLCELEEATTVFHCDQKYTKACMWVYLIMRYEVQKWLHVPTTHMESSYRLLSLLSQIKIWLLNAEVYYIRMFYNKEKWSKLGTLGFSCPINI